LFSSSRLDLGQEREFGRTHGIWFSGRRSVE
jgi:hypothetical protein